MKLTAKLTLLFVLLTTLPLCLVGYLAFVNGQRTIHQNTDNLLVSTNNLKKASFIDWIDNKKNQLSIFAKRPLIIDYSRILTSSGNEETTESKIASRKVIDEHFKISIEGGGGFFELMILRPSDGMIVVSTDERHKLKYREDQPFFKYGKKRTYVQNAYYSLSMEQALLTVSTPIRDEKGNLIAVLAGNLDLAEITEIMLQDSGETRTKETYLVNKFNFMITESRLMPGSLLKRAIYTEGAKNALGGKSGVGNYEDYRGMLVFGAYSWLPEYELAILTEMDAEEALEPVLAFRNRMLIIMFLVILVVTVIGIVVSRTITEPIRKLMIGIEEFGRGTLDQKIDVSSVDEIGQLADSFNQMAEERKRVEEELQKINKELEGFSYSVSHDLRAPLRAVSGFSSVMMEDYGDQIDDEGKRYLGLIVKNTAKMGNLIDDLLKFSRMGRTDMTLTIVDMKKVAMYAYNEMKSVYEDREIEISMNSLSNVRGDSKLLKQVFLNLISNAMKYTAGEQVVKIEIGSKVNQDHVTYFVKDNGVGFDMKYVHKLFGVFQRLHSEKDFEGTGVGLALVQKIIHRHGGNVWAEGKVNEGATFFFSLPNKGVRHERE